MNSENILLDKVKEICSISSDNALATKLGMQRQAISKIRNGDMAMPDARIAELCGMANLDAPLWLAKIHAERATSTVEKAMWRTALDRLSAAAAVVALVCAGSFAGQVKASEINSLRASNADNLYIMLKAEVGCCSISNALVVAAGSTT